eukprot:g2741.t1
MSIFLHYCLFVAIVVPYAYAIFDQRGLCRMSSKGSSCMGAPGQQCTFQNRIQKSIFGTGTGTCVVIDEYKTCECKYGLIHSDEVKEAKLQYQNAIETVKRFHTEETLPGGWKWRDANSEFLTLTVTNLQGDVITINDFAIRSTFHTLKEKIEGITGEHANNIQIWESSSNEAQLSDTQTLLQCFERNSIKGILFVYQIVDFWSVNPYLGSPGNGHWWKMPNKLVETNPLYGRIASKYGRKHLVLKYYSDDLQILPHPTTDIEDLEILVPSSAQSLTLSGEHFGKFKLSFLEEPGISKNQLERLTIKSLNEEINDTWPDSIIEEDTPELNLITFKLVSILKANGIFGRIPASVMSNIEYLNIDSYISETNVFKGLDIQNILTAIKAMPKLKKLQLNIPVRRIFDDYYNNIAGPRDLCRLSKSNLIELAQSLPKSLRVLDLNNLGLDGESLAIFLQKLPINLPKLEVIYFAKETLNVVDEIAGAKTLDIVGNWLDEKSRTRTYQSLKRVHMGKIPNADNMVNIMDYPHPGGRAIYRMSSWKYDSERGIVGQKCKCGHCYLPSICVCGPCADASKLSRIGYDFDSVDRTIHTTMGTSRLRRTKRVNESPKLDADITGELLKRNNKS